MKTFEYKTVYFKLPLMKGFQNNDEDLNKLGREGWECVSAYPYTSGASTSGTAYLLKREIEIK